MPLALVSPNAARYVSRFADLWPLTSVLDEIHACLAFRIYDKLGQSFRLNNPLVDICLIIVSGPETVEVKALFFLMIAGSQHTHHFGTCTPIFDHIATSESRCPSWVMMCGPDSLSTMVGCIHILCDR